MPRGHLRCTLPPHASPSQPCVEYRLRRYPFLNPWSYTGAPVVDVVFVHGIRGGPFATWRASGGEYGAASRNLRHGVCWPSAWLADDVPGARLLSMEYASPISSWEVRVPYALIILQMDIYPGRIPRPSTTSPETHPPPPTHDIHTHTPACTHRCIL